MGRAFKTITKLKRRKAYLKRKKLRIKELKAGGGAPAKKK